MKKGPYTILSTKSIYKNPWIEVREDKVVRPDGKKGVFGVINYSRGASVVAIDSNKKIYLIREYCYAIEKYDLKIPSGGIDNGETPLKAIKRELKEETGIIAKNWIELGFINPLNMILNNSAYLFLALNLTYKNKTEKDIEVVPMPFEKAYQMVIDGKITHAPSCVAILKAKIYLDSVR